MRRFFNIIFSICALLLLAGCSLKNTCDYCREEKFCKEYDILGTTRYICDDCLAHNDFTVSSNVYTSYVADPIDPQLISTPSPEPTSDTDASAPGDSSLSTTPAPTAQPATETYMSRDEALSTIAATLSEQGFSLSPDPDDANHYDVYAGGNDTNIDIVFSYDNIGRLNASVKRASNASDTDYASCCICTILTFVKSTDFSGTGFEIYNTTTAHGNYTFDNCRFYFLDGNVSETSQNSASFDISFR